jgi:hypothetical protein
MKKKFLIGCLALLPFAFVALIVSPCILGVLDAMWEDAKDYPGKPLFAKENHKIDVYGGTIAFGNSPQAVAVADEFFHELEAISGVFFTGGSKFTPATAGHFLTYCRVGPKGVVVLCQVPDLRGYEGKARDTLMTLAWSAAQSAALKAKVDPHLPLVVGLRGFGSYGPVMIGQMTGEPTTRNDDIDGRPRLYPYFIDSTPGD